MFLFFVGLFVVVVVVFSAVVDNLMGFVVTLMSLFFSLGARASLLYPQRGT